MSIQIMNAVWRESKSKGRARLVLLSIADHQGELGAWPSIETLAKMVNSSPRSVQRDIQDLIELGELVVEFRSAPTYGPYKANRYFVNLPGVTNEVSEVTKTASEVTDLDSEVTESASEVTAGGVLTLNRTLKETLTKQADESFETFWNLYPKKVAKADALKAWKQVLKKKTADEMIGLTKAYSESKLPDMTYIPYPASWLNKGLYEAVEVQENKPLQKLKIGKWHD
jgi:hypothetical protein